MLPPSGDQYEIRGGGYRAVVTESGAALRLLEHAGRPLLDGFAEDERSPGGRGQVLVPWPNRLRDGAYTFAGRDQQLALTEPALHNASHGLVRWVAWSLEEHTAHSVSLTYRLMAQTGYPWTLDLHLVYDLSADGLTVTRTATNMSAEAAPYAAGAHPYLAVGDGIDHLELTLPAATRSLVDDRLLPVGREPVEGTAYDFRVARPLRGTGFNDAFTDLERDEDGLATTVLRDPRTGQGVALWVDRAHPWLQVYSADDVPGNARRSLAVEPMTAQADAFRSGEDLLVLAPAGQDGDEHSASWGVRALD
ncbi:MAG: aldose 1-epimerase family protein [Nocardioides sp.]